MEQISEITKKVMCSARELRTLVPYDERDCHIISSMYVKSVEQGCICGDDDLFLFAKEFISRQDSSTQYYINRALESCDADDMRNLAIELTESEPTRDSYDISSSSKIANLYLCLLMINRDDFVWDFGSGNGSFLLKLHNLFAKEGMESPQLNGIEVNYSAAMISKMYSALIGKPINVIAGDLLKCEVAPFTSGFVFPPFGLKTKMLYDEETAYNRNFSFRNSSETFFVDKMIKTIRKKGGRGMAIVSSRALFNSEDRAYWFDTMKDSLLKAIITLPAGALNGTLIPSHILIFDREEEIGDYRIKLIDASDCMEKVNGRTSPEGLNINEILRRYYANDCFMASMEDFCSVENFTPAVIIAKAEGAKLNKNVHKLSDLADVFTGCQYTVRNFQDKFSNNPTGYKIITSSDIVDGYVDWKSLQSVKLDDNKFDKYAVSLNDIIVTSKSSKVKTVVVDIEPNEKIIVTGGMLIIRPFIDRLNPFFLKSYLESSNGKKELEIIKKGVNIISINAKDLSGISIDDMPRDKQNMIAKEYVSKMSELLALKMKISRLENELATLYEDCTEGI